MEIQAMPLQRYIGLTPLNNATFADTIINKSQRTLNEWCENGNVMVVDNLDDTIDIIKIMYHDLKKPNWFSPSMELNVNLSGKLISFNNYIALNYESSSEFAREMGKARQFISTLSKRGNVFFLDHGNGTFDMVTKLYVNIPNLITNNKI